MAEKERTARSTNAESPEPTAGGAADAVQTQDEQRDACEPMESKHQLFELGALLRARSSSTDDTKGVIDLLRSHGSRRTLVRVPQNYAAVCSALGRVFPNFVEFLDDHLLPQMALSHLSERQQLKFTPLLLLGPPGIGKSTFCDALAGELGLPFQRINLEAAQASFEIAGVSRGWNSAGPGRLVRWLSAKIPVNGICVMEELDKAGGDERYDSKAALLQLLEDTTAKAFCDQSMPEVPFDMTSVNFVFTANTLDGLSAPLLDRMTVLEVPPMTVEQAREAARRQYGLLLENFKLPGEPPTLTSEALETLSAVSPRRQRQLLRLALGRAIAHSSSSLSIRSTQAPSRHQMGFI